MAYRNTLLSFDIDYNELSIYEQHETANEMFDLCASAIEHIIGIHRNDWKQYKGTDDKILYTWRNIYIYSLSRIFNVPSKYIASDTGLSASMICVVLKRIDESKSAQYRDRLNKMYNFINKYY